MTFNEIYMPADRLYDAREGGREKRGRLEGEGAEREREREREEMETEEVE